MVQRAINTENNEEVDANTAYELYYPENKYNYKCLDSKCDIPLTLYTSPKNNLYHFTESHHNSPHIKECLSVLEEQLSKNHNNNKINGIKKMSSLIPKDNIVLTSRTIKKGKSKRKITKSNGTKNIKNKSNKTHISSMQTLLDRIHFGSIRKDYIVPVHFEYDDIRNNANGKDGQRKVEELIKELDDNFKLTESRFYYFKFVAFVDKYPTFYKISSAKSDENGSRLVTFINAEDKSLSRTSLGKQLEQLSKKKYPELIFAAGDVIYNKKHKSYNLNKEFFSSARTFYIPKW
ncbi:hypothetical protein [Apilactobacillus quenuiae]|uniref:hypothetical protein n=1 Tax=Apilactobacillus quenuiae TaxID=2008377 RepID=UPI000D014E8E|nr:hypothetical protein [Apilactobacillus quenuiae]